MKTYEILNQLIKSKSVCIIAHIDPDPDALSSMVVLRDFIKNHFKIKTVDIFAEFQNITNSAKEILGNVPINTNFVEYDTAIMLDCPNTQRIGKYVSLFENSKTKIVIDHHATNNYDGDINIVEICSSTCEIVYSILKYFNHKISTENQGKIYAGILTDTNNFTVGAFGKRTFQIASEIAENIEIDAIYRAFLANNTKKTMKLLAKAIENMSSFENDKIIISYITHEQANELNANHVDMCGIVNQIATINTAKLICFIEPRNGAYYASMRAKKNYDVSQIAKNNGGGGHIGAAAFIAKGSLEELINLILDEFKQQLSSVKEKPSKLFK